MKNTATSIFIICSLGAAVGGGGIVGLQRGFAKERGLDRAEEQWNAYVARIANFEGDVVGTTRCNRSILDNEEEVEKCKIVVGRYPMALLYDHAAGDSDVFREVIGMNDDYHFQIVRSKKDPQAWIARDVAKNASRPTTYVFPTRSVFDTDLPSDTIVGSFFCRPIAVYSTPLPTLLKLPGCEVESMEATSRDGEEVVTLKYTYEPKTMPRKIYERSGIVRLLPDHYWLVDSADFFTGAAEGSQPRVQISVRNEYNFKDFSIPLLVSNEWKCYDNTPDKTWRYTTLTHFRWRETEEQGPDRFMLTAFGLPEPEFDSGVSRYRLWSVIGGAILFCIVLCVWSLRRSRKQ